MSDHNYGLNLLALFHFEKLLVKQYALLPRMRGRSVIELDTSSIIHLVTPNRPRLFGANVTVGSSWCVFRDTKDEDISRGAAIHDQLIAVLRSVIGDGTEGNVFLTDDGVPYKTVPKTAWRGACRRAGIEDLHIHDLRHTFATYALVAGGQAGLSKSRWTTREPRICILGMFTFPART